MFNILSHQGNESQNYMSSYLTPVRMSIMKRTNNKYGEVVEEKKLLLTAWKCKLISMEVLSKN
jgi:hypothetical protein